MTRDGSNMSKNNKRARKQVVKWKGAFKAITPYQECGLTGRQLFTIQDGNSKLVGYVYDTLGWVHACDRDMIDSKAQFHPL